MDMKKSKKVGWLQGGGWVVGIYTQTNREKWRERRERVFIKSR